jgi:hypothetical protein
VRLWPDSHRLRRYALSPFCILFWFIVSQYLVTPLDDLAWILNLRGNDMFNQPFFYAYLFVSPTDAVLFIDPKKVTSEVEDYLTGLGVRTQAYGTVWDFLKAETEQDPKASQPSLVYRVLTAFSVHSPR